MNRARYLLLANSMWAANVFANQAAAASIMILSRGLEQSASPATLATMTRFKTLFPIAAFLVASAALIIYELPIRRLLSRVYRGDAQVESGGADTEPARRRLLNEPYFAALLDLGTWLVGAVLVGLIIARGGEPLPRAALGAARSILCGLIAMVAAFFLIDQTQRRWLVPVLFPRGGLWQTPGGLRLRVGVRLAALAMAISVLPWCMAVLGILAFRIAPGLSAEQALAGVVDLVLLSSVVFLPVVVGLTYLVSANLSRPIDGMIVVLQQVREGNFSERVIVVSNDELGFAGDVVNEMSAGLEEREVIREAFGKYVSDEVRDEVLSGRVPFDGEMKEVTVLFSDLRNFTPMTESNDPKLVVRLMNGYFQEMADAIKLESGLVLQYIGDEIYAVFGAPVPRDDHAARAFRAALAMRRRLAQLNRRFAEQDWPALQHGIGLHSGQALAANIGSRDRLSYLLVGDTVNLASRLQSLTKEVGFPMVISAATHDRLSQAERKAAVLHQLPPTMVKGKSKPVHVYGVEC